MQEYFRYFPVSRAERQWGLYVSGAGTVLNAAPDTDPLAHPEPYYFRWSTGRRMARKYAIVYHPHSSIELESEATPLGVVPAGNFIVLCPGMWHRYRPVAERRWTQYWAWFGGSYADHLLRSGVLSSQEPLHQVGMDVRLLAPFQRLLDRLDSNAPGHSQLLAASVMEILGVALSLSHAGCGRDLDEDLARQAKGLLEERVEERIDMEELAESLETSCQRLRCAFKHLTGVSPYQYHLRLRLDRAKQMLAQTDLPVKAIAGLLNFNDAYHFSKSFRQHVGVSPSDWRSQRSAEPLR